MLQFEWWTNWVESITQSLSLGAFSVVFLFFGLLAFGWLAVHVEHARHYSRIKIIFAMVLGAIFIGYGIHFLLLSFGA